MDLKKTRTVLLVVIGIVALAVFILSGVHVVSYLRSAAESTDSMDKLREYVAAESEEDREVSAEGSSQSIDSAVPYKSRRAPVRVDFTALQSINPDISAWLYCKAIEFNHPIMYSGDNEYYLDHLSDRSYNSAGSLFIDEKNAPDFTDAFTVIYGHNMLNKSMFGKLPNYTDPAYYQKAPDMYILMPEHSYLLELLARDTVIESSAVYSLIGTQAEAERLEDLFPAETRFRENTAFQDGDRYVLLSTCTYEAEGNRFVVLGRLIELSTGE